MLSSLGPSMASRSQGLSRSCGGTRSMHGRWRCTHAPDAGKFGQADGHRFGEDNQARQLSFHVTVERYACSPRGDDGGGNGRGHLRGSRPARKGSGTSGMGQSAGLSEVDEFRVVDSPESSNRGPPKSEGVIEGMYPFRPRASLSGRWTMCPLLSRYVREPVAQEIEILKERRKTMKERARRLEATSRWRKLLSLRLQAPDWSHSKDLYLETSCHPRGSADSLSDKGSLDDGRSTEKSLRQFWRSMFSMGILPTGMLISLSTSTRTAGNTQGGATRPSARQRFQSWGSLRRAARTSVFVWRKSIGRTSALRARPRLLALCVRRMQACRIPRGI